MLKYSYDSSGDMASETLESVLPPQIIGQPVKQIVAPGEVASFSVVVSDANGVTFQWKFNGTDIPGATGDSFLLTKKILKADEGQYSAVVTNSVGSVTSASAELMLDSDDNGLPDNWEILNFGGQLGGQRSEGDPDQDGISNIDEFFDGTDPRSNTSLRPRLTAFSDAGGSVTVVPMKLSYDLGETVTLTATPFAPGVFVGWAGAVNGASFPTALTMNLTMNGNKTLRARFASAVPIPPGLVAFWRGETDASDLVGGHHGTFFVGTSPATQSFTAPGKVGNALSFDGTVHVRVPDSAALKPAQITLEAWVFPTVQTRDAFHTIIAHGFSRPAARPGVILEQQTWYLGVNTAQPHFFTFPDDDLAHPNAGNQGPETVPLNQWTHLAASFDGTTKRLYVNGVLVNSRRSLDLGH
jgi:Concanavalin A-like lectin/glucanases superfamily/Divergent InlB B-repeat domain/Immunoglobulin I-set domain